MKKSGFTLAETLMTMAIIGVCAAMLISTVKNLHTDDLSNDVMAKKAVSTFSDASRQVLVMESKSKKMSDITGCANSKDLFNLMGKYLQITNVLSEDDIEAGKDSSSDLVGDVYGRLSDGLVFGLTYDPTCATTGTARPLPDSAGVAVTNACGIIYYDVNGNKKPNQIGVDRFSIPIYKTGVKMPSAQAT